MACSGIMMPNQQHRLLRATSTAAQPTATCSLRRQGASRRMVSARSLANSSGAGFPHHDDFEAWEPWEPLAENFTVQKENVSTFKQDLPVAWGPVLFPTAPPRRYSLQDWRSFRARLVSLERCGNLFLGNDDAPSHVPGMLPSSLTGACDPCTQPQSPSASSPSTAATPAKPSTSTPRAPDACPSQASNTTGQRTTPGLGQPTASTSSTAESVAAPSAAVSTSTGRSDTDSKATSSQSAASSHKGQSTHYHGGNRQDASRRPSGSRSSGPGQHQPRPSHKRTHHHHHHHQPRQQQRSAKPAPAKTAVPPPAPLILAGGPGSWAHLLGHAEPGCLLLSRGGAEMGFFDRAVILVTSHSDSRGSVGFVLNRPCPLKVSELQLASACPGFMETFSQERLQIGGPMHMDHATVLHRFMGLSGANEVADKLYAGGLPDAMRLVEAGLAKPSDFHLMLGVSGWAPGQLQGEIARGMWHCVSASPDLVLPRKSSAVCMADLASLARDGQDMWARILAIAAGPEALPRSWP